MPESKKSLSQRAFRGLLKILPFDFRANFGGEMERVFDEQKRDVEKRGGIVDFARLWWKRSPAFSAPRRASIGKS